MSLCNPNKKDCQNLSIIKDSLATSKKMKSDKILLFLLFVVLLKIKIVLSFIFNSASK